TPKPRCRVLSAPQRCDYATRLLRPQFHPQPLRTRDRKCPRSSLAINPFSPRAHPGSFAMNLARTHAWPTQWGDAAALQTELSDQVAESDAPGPFRLVAGADISYTRGDDRIFAAVVVLALPNFTVVE